MLGYCCPCCGELIAISVATEKRDCPTCKASVETQTIARAKRREQQSPDRWIEAGSTQ